MLSVSPALLSLGIPLSAVAGLIISTGVVHTFLNYIPSALIGAPDGDTALAASGHRMLLVNAAGVLHDPQKSTRINAITSPHCGSQNNIWSG